MDFNKPLRSLLSLVLLLSFALSFIFATLPRAAQAATGKGITIGFIPGENPEVLKENGEEIAKLIQGKIGVPVSIYVAKDYNDLIVAMKEKRVDFAFFAAMSFVFAEKMAGAKVLLKKVWDTDFYYAAILSRGDQNLTKLSQLKGKRFAFVDQKSGSGYLYPQVFFKKNNIDPKTYFKDVIFSGNHTESIRLLREGKVDAVAVFSNDAKAKDSAWERFPDKTGAKIPKPKLVWVSAPIPTDPFVVRQDFYDANPRIAHDLMFALIELDDDVVGGAKFKKLLNITSLKIATSQQYEPVREMVKELDLKLESR